MRALARLNPNVLRPAPTGTMTKTMANHIGRLVHRAMLQITQDFSDKPPYAPGQLPAYLMIPTVATYLEQNFDYDPPAPDVKPQPRYNHVLNFLRETPPFDRFAWPAPIRGPDSPEPEVGSHLG